MTWKKGQFLITIYDGDEKVRQTVNGITSNTGTIAVGIHKAESKDWIVTDIATGYMIHISDTQKQAKEWTEENAPVIEEILNTEKHDRLIEEVRRCKIKKL